MNDPAFAHVAEVETELFGNYPYHGVVRIYLVEVTAGHIVNVWSNNRGWSANKLFSTREEAKDYYENLCIAATLQALPDLWGR